MNNYHVLTTGGGLRPLAPGELHKRGAAHEGRDERSRGGGRRAESDFERNRRHGAVANIGDNPAGNCRVDRKPTCINIYHIVSGGYGISWDRWEYKGFLSKFRWKNIFIWNKFGVCCPRLTEVTP